VNSCLASVSVHTCGFPWLEVRGLNPGRQIGILQEQAGHTGAEGSDGRC
jgi:hypothetical protein